nr:MAG TPA: hypothetical protein [Caudoviricetes sp.]
MIKRSEDIGGGRENNDPLSIAGLLEKSPAGIFDRTLRVRQANK